MKRRTRPVGLVIGLVLGLAACQSSSPAATPSAAPPSESASPSPVAEPFELTIFGAASLTAALADVETAYEAAVPGADLLIATDSSAALRTQIEVGAPADVFLSADTSNPDMLVDGGLALGDPVPFAGNTLALIVPLDNPAGIQTPADIANQGVKIVAGGDEVPITAYANQVVTNLASVRYYPPDFAARYASNIVSREDNVRGIVTKIEQGVGDAGFVYQTDALTSELAASFQIPSEANVHAVYAGVVVAETDNPEQAQAFLDWLVGPDGQAILAESGFVAP